MKYSPKLISLDWNSFKRIRVGCIFRMAALHLGYLSRCPHRHSTTRRARQHYLNVYSHYDLISPFLGWHVLAFWQITRCSVEVATEKYFFHLFCPSFPSNSSLHLNKASEKAHFPSLIILSLCFVSNFITHFLSSLNLQLLFRNGGRHGSKFCRKKKIITRLNFLLLNIKFWALAATVMSRKLFRLLGIKFCQFKHNFGNFC